MLNPVLEETRGEQYGDEGCLSLPNLWYKTKRADYARVRSMDLDGNEIVLEETASWAVCSSTRLTISTAISI